MLLNRMEYVLMNNPLRPLVQRYFEARRLLRMGGAMSGGRALVRQTSRDVPILEAPLRVWLPRLSWAPCYSSP